MNANMSCNPKRRSNKADKPFLQAGIAAVGLVLSLGLLNVGASETAEIFLRGSLDVATQRAVINFAELAREADPLPDGAEAAELASASMSGGLPSPAPASSFMALDDNGTAPLPDTHGAVGPDHLVLAHNVRVRIQDRSGNILSTVHFTNFWSAVGPFDVTKRCYLCDPRVLYDPYGARWIIFAMADIFTTNAAVLIGVSQTSDPTGQWNLYRSRVDPAGRESVDYPSMGFNKDWIVTQIDHYGGFTTNSLSSFLGSRVYVFNKTNLYANGDGLFTKFDTTIKDYTQFPASTYDNSLSAVYLLGTEGSGVNQNKLRIYSITGPVGAEVFTTGPLISVIDGWGEMAPGGFNAEFLPQLDGSRGFRALDSIIQSLVYRNGSLWASHYVFLPPGGNANRAAVQWWQLSPQGAILQRGLIDDPTGNNHFAFPSLAVNQFNDVLLGYNRFSATQYVSANYAFRAGNDPLNVLRSETLLKSGEAAFVRPDALDHNRWGDFSATVVDPLNDADLWTIQEYAASPVTNQSRWGTWWGRVLPPDLNLTVTDVTVTEGDSGFINAVFTARLSAVTNVPVSVDFATEDGSAMAGIDYAPTNGTIVLLPGETNKTFTVTVNGDTVSEATETFFVRLSNQTNIVFVTTLAQGTILNDDLFITRQPQGINARPGDTVAFSVTGEGPPPIRYQWRFRGENLADETNDMLTLTDVQLADDGPYTCVLDNGVTEVLSDSANLTVLIDPIITVAPVSQSVVAGGSATFSVAFTGNPIPFGVEWRQGSLRVASNTVLRFHDFYTLTNAQTSQEGTWRVVVRNLARNVTVSEFRAFKLSVLPDADGDGLPDEWELAHGFPTNDSNNATIDADGDGLTNGQEYQAGTNPTNASSYLKVDSVSLANEGSAVQLTFFAASNNTYTVESRLGADAGEWMRLVDVVAASSNRVLEILDPLEFGVSVPRYYRLVTPRVP